MDTKPRRPRSVDKTDVVFDYYFADVSEHAREKNLASIAVSEQIQSEDVAICESVQPGLASRSYNRGRLSVRREAGEYLFHKLLSADLHTAMEKNAGRCNRAVNPAGASHANQVSRKIRLSGAPHSR